MLTDKEVARYHWINLKRSLLGAFIISFALFIIIGLYIGYQDMKEYETKRQRIISGSR